MVSSTSAMEARIKRVLSYTISTVTSSGRSFFNCSIRLYASSAISIWLAPGCGMMTSITIGSPFLRITLRKSSGLTSARPTSWKRMILSPSRLMIKSLNSVAVCISPNVRIDKSIVFPSMLPEGSSTFSASTAFFTSNGVIP